ncbi:MAG: hypothetical protein ACYS6W_02860 [Planctomycetota bacterium]
MRKNRRRVSDKSPVRRVRGSAARDELALGQDRFKLTKLDYILAPLIGLFASLFTFPHVGTAINWDDLLYMNMSMNTAYETWQPYVVNRYGHIYLLKFFFFITGDCITAGRVYWCFMFFFTGVLVYWCSRILAGKKGCLVGIIAAVLFLVQPLFVVREWGCVLADFSAMLWVMLGAFVYLAFPVNTQQHRRWILMALGFIFFWGMKSKETSICMVVLFLGLGEDETGAHSIGRFFRDIVWVCLGGLAGCVILVILDGVFLGDAFFSIRLSRWKELLSSSLVRPPDDLSYLARTREVMSWYAGIAKERWLVVLFGPFVLYLLIGWKSVSREFKLREKMVWLVPIVLLLFLTYIRSTFWVLPRYFSPAIPLICVWGAQFFWFDVSGAVSIGKNHQTIPKMLVAAGLIILAFLVVYVLMSFMPEVSGYYKFMRYDILKARFKTSENVFYAVGIVPLVVTILLVLGTFFKKRGLTVLFISFTCLFLLVWHPFRSNFSGMKATVERSKWRFLPYEVFKDEFQFDKDIKVLVSKDVFERSWMLGNYAFRHCWMFNIFFNQKYTDDNFIHGTQEDILKGGYTYGFITAWEWEEIGKKHNVDHLKKNYTMRLENVGGRIPIILLKRR